MLVLSLGYKSLPMARGHTEAAVRALRIDGQLAKAGWSPTAVDFEIEYEVASAGEPDHGFSDYMLPGPDGLPLSIVEAKRSSRDALAGKEQASRYADAIEASTGRRPLVFLANGDEIWFWDFVTNPRRVGGFFRQEDLERRLFQLTYAQDLGPVTIDTTIIERPYQHEAVRRAHEAFEKGRRKALWVMATGTGKTRTAAALIDTMVRARWSQKVLFLVDRTALAQQALDAFNEHLPGEPSEIIRSSSYDGTKRLYVATLQTMQDFYESFSAGAFDLIFSDESHRSIYNKWRSVISYFDARLVGLTATPADFLDRNTFAFFDCTDRKPTFSYELEEGIEDKYLAPYEVYHARTSIQIRGIRGSELTPEERARLVDEGVDPDDLDFAGTELERKVTNIETTRLLVSEFFDNAIKEPDANLPGKSIIFAMSHAHAKRLWEMFNSEYPQFPGMTEIIDSHMEDADATLRRFKNESLPRIAISVDMLDTGVDVPTVVNLGLLKPVFSKIKFWQMIGRGTRRVDTPEAAKPWCSVGAKDAFRVLDFWENFERFQLNPEGVEPSSSTPVAVRLFRLLCQAARAAGAAARADLRDEFIGEIREMIARLPVESAGVREERKLLEDVGRDSFWVTLTAEKFQVLSLRVAPLMRFLADADLARLSFDAKCLDFVLAALAVDKDAIGAAAEKIRDDIIRLPPEQADVKPHVALITRAHQTGWTDELTVDDVLRLRALLGPLMHFKQPEPVHIITLDIDDVFQEQRWIAAGPEGTEFETGEYRDCAIARIKELGKSVPALQKLLLGEELVDSDVASIETALNQPELYIRAETLQQAFRAPHAGLLALLRHALGLAPLETRETAVRQAIEAFTADRGYLAVEELLFVRLFTRRLIDAGRVSRADLFEEPFVRLGAEPPLDEEDIDSLLGIAAEYGVPDA